MSITAAWFGGGIVAAAIHATSLWRSVHSFRGHLVFAFIRFLVVGIVLFAGAVMGHLGAVAGGWAVGFITSALLIVTARPVRNQSSGGTRSR